MADLPVKRRLAAILSADVVGYTTLMEADEAGTLAALRTRRRDILGPLVAEHAGRVVKVMGDGVLVEFASAVGAVACAAALQERMAAANADVAEDRRIVLRVGVNFGELIVEGSDVYGDSVNIAARLQALAEPGAILISGKVLKEVQRALPFTFADMGEQRVKNLSAPVHVFRVEPRAAPALAHRAVLMRPAVAVLPFLNLSGDPGQDYFVDGVTEDIITALSAWRWFPVIARNSTFVYKDRAVDVTRIGRELRARYVLEGSVRRANGRVRIAAQLIEVETAHHIWAQNYDRELGDVFALQDELTRALIGAIEPQLARAEQQRALRKPPENLDAWDLCLQALAEIRRGTAQSLKRADALLLQALTMEAHSSHAHSTLALARFQNALLGGWLNDPQHAFDATYEAAQAAVELDDGDWQAHALLGIATLWSNGDYDQAMVEEETAIALNPSAALAYHFYGCVLTFNDRSADALPHLQAVLQLDPRFQLLPTTLADIGLAHFLLGDYAAAVHFCERALSEQRDHVRAWQRLAAALGQLGRIDEAKAAFAEVLARQPTFGRAYLEKTYPFRNRTHAALLEQGLKRAGWED